MTAPDTASDSRITGPSESRKGTQNSPATINTVTIIIALNRRSLRSFHAKNEAGPAVRNGDMKNPSPARMPPAHS